MADRHDQCVEKIRAAIKDRATWFALLYKSFGEALPHQEVERLARKAIREFGRLKASKDPKDFGPSDWVRKHCEKGSSLVFDSEVEIGKSHSVQRMKRCPLVEAWREMGCSEDEIRLFCDIAMEGDRGRAESHGVCLEITKRLADGGPFCELRLTTK